MKNHPVRIWPAFSGENSTDDPDRIEEDELALNFNAICDFTGRIGPWSAIYPVVNATNLGVTGTKAKVHAADRFRGKNGQARAVAIVGATMMRTGPNNIYQTWVPITFPTDYSTPSLNRAAQFVFKNRKCYHQNGVDLPFMVTMENDDLSAPTTLAEIMGLRAPLSVCQSGSETVGTKPRFPIDRQTTYAVTFVYGTRGESGPSPFVTFEPVATVESQTLTNIPLGPTGVTARRIYRSQIGAGSTRISTDTKYIDWPEAPEMFFLAELSNNTTASFTDNLDDSKLDFSRRCPPPRPMVPIAHYQRMHQDRVVWANLIDSPLVLHVCSVESSGGGVINYAVTVSNTGNGTITFLVDTGAGLVTDFTITNYKTRTLSEIRGLIMSTYTSQIGATAPTGTAYYGRVAPGIDDTRTYRFRAVTNQTIFKNANVYSFEAIDDDTDAVVVDGAEKHPNRIMWSDETFVEEINPFNRFDFSRHDVYPITGTFRNDYTFAVCTQDAIWLLTGSMSNDPTTFIPDFSISRSQSEHGSYCTRPDAVVETPGGILFVARDGLRIFQGQSSKRYFRGIRTRLMKRILVEPRARDNLSMCYEGGILYIAYAGDEVA